jgi:hypothetical protein
VKLQAVVERNAFLGRVVGQGTLRQAYEIAHGHGGVVVKQLNGNGTAVGVEMC